MTFCDAHFHLVQTSHMPFFEGESYRACSCAHEEGEFLRMEGALSVSTGGAVVTAGGSLVSGNASVTAGPVAAAPGAASFTPPSARIISAFGIHPQNPDLNRLPFLERLLKEGRIGAIGEAGFDLFTPEFSARIAEQEEAWKAQLALAQDYGLPLVIHSRKATDRFFRDIRELKKLKAVIFHSYAGTKNEAESFLKRGVNAYFSFGKPLINGKKSALECAAALEAGRILLETDAPYQTLKGESETFPEEIERVYKKAAEIRGCALEELALQIEKNFCRAFGAGGS